MRVKSLLEICQASLLQNASNISWLGNIPFKLIEAFLKKISPKQLAGIELWNPHLTIETQDLWKTHCIDEYSDLKRLFLDGSLPEPESWRDLYNLKKTQMDEKTARVAEKLRGMKQEHELKKNSRNAKILDQNSLLKLTKKTGTRTPPIAKRKLGTLFQKTLKEVGKSPLYGSGSSKTPSSSKRSEAANLFMGYGNKKK